MFEDYRNPNDYWMQNNKDVNDETYEQGCLTTILYIVIFIVAILLCALMSGCKSVEYVFVPQTHTDTLIVTKVQHDSIYINDSTVITEKGDTVRIEKWHTKYVEKQVHDTVYQSKRDSIPYPVEVIKEVPRPLTKTQIVMMIVGFVCTALVVIYIGKKRHALLP